MACGMCERRAAGRPPGPLPFSEEKGQHPAACARAAAGAPGPSFWLYSRLIGSLCPPLPLPSPPTTHQPFLGPPRRCRGQPSRGEPALDRVEVEAWRPVAVRLDRRFGSRDGRVRGVEEGVVLEGVEGGHATFREWASALACVPGTVAPPAGRGGGGRGKRWMGERKEECNASRVQNKKTKKRPVSRPPQHPPCSSCQQRAHPDVRWCPAPPRRPHSCAGVPPLTNPAACSPTPPRPPPSP
jgi:hypothetical protein